MSGSATNSAASLIRAEEDEPQLKKLRQSDSQRKDEGIDRRASAKKSKKTASLLRFKKSGKVSHQNEINKPNGWVNAQKTRKNGTSTAPSGKSIPQTETFTQKNEQKQSFSNFVKSMFGSGEEELNINRSERTKLFYFGFLLPALALHPESLKECDTPKYDEDFKLRLAAAHINDAIHSRGKFGQARALLKSEYVQKCYAIISSKYWEYLMYLFIGLHCFMAFWEQSPVPTPVGQPWSDNWVMHVSVLVIDAMCSVIYVIDIILWTGFLSWSHFWSAKENFWIRVEFVFTAMFIIDYVILVCERALNQRLIAPFRCLRAAMLLCKSKNVSHIFKVLISIMSRLGKVFSIILIFIFTFASIGLHLYMDDYHEVYQSCSSGTQVNCTSVYSGAFDNVAIASLHMFVLMSTENYPDIIIPAFSASEANFFYFMFYLYAGVFFLTAILLAIIVESYWEYSKKHVKMERLRQREELIRAWNLLDLDGNGYLSVDDQKLVKLFSILRPKNTEDENQQLVQYMSENNEDYVIDSFDWTTRLVETLSIEFEPEIQEREGSENISVCRSIRKFSSKIIHANGIGVAILVFILLHSIFFCLMWHGITDTTQLALQGSRTVIVFLFVLEAILRITSDGAKLLNILDVLDILMVVIAVAGNVTWYILWFGLAHTTSHQLYIGACVVTSSLAVLARLLFNSEQARSAFHILKNIYPVMFDLILLVISIIYFYAIIGLEIFQDNTLQKSSEEGFVGSYQQYNCGVGFQTFGCSLMIVFQIVTTNDWHQIMLGAMIDAGWASSFYFVSCYLIIDMIVMNLFVAISIEAYKKLARDDREVAANPPTEEEQTVDSDDTPNDGSRRESVSSNSNRPSKSKMDRTIGEVAKDAFTGIFASTRNRKLSTTTANSLAAPGNMQVGRKGPRGSIATLSVHTETSDDSDSGDATVLSWGGVQGLPGSPWIRNKNLRLSNESGPRKRLSSSNSPDPTGLIRTSSVKDRSSPAVDRRQRLFKARSERVRRERKEKQKQMQEQQPKSNTLVVPTPKLSISDVVRLKKMVKILQPFNATSENEMDVEQGQMFAISEENGEMYRGPHGWFPKDVAIDVSMKAGSGPFEGNPNKKRRTGKVVNFKIENETNNDTSPTPPEKLSPAPHSHVMQHRQSMSRMRMKKDGNAWRRDILGDMTVMNKQEAEELQKKLKGGRMNFERHQSRHLIKSEVSRLSLLNTKKPHNGILQDTIEEQEEEATPTVPEVRVSEPQTSPEASGESNDDTNTNGQNTGTLTVPKSTHKKLEKPKGNGEMPEWMKKFAATKGVTFQEDLKFDETSLRSKGSSDDEDQVAVLVHQTDRSRESSFENLQTAVKSAKEQASHNKITANASNESNTPVKGESKDELVDVILQDDEE